MEPRHGTLVWASVTIAAVIIGGIFQIRAAHEHPSGKTDITGVTDTAITDEKVAQTESAARQAIAEAQRVAEDERKKREAAEAEAAKLRMENHIEKRHALMATMVTSFVSNGTDQFDKITLQNDCRETIHVAIRYLSLDKVWVTEGWWIVASRTSVLTNLQSRGQTAYFYAKSDKYIWNGETTAGSVTNSIRGGRFIIIGAETIGGPDVTSVSFTPMSMESGWGNRTKTFVCS